LGLAQPLWSFGQPGSRGHLDFGEQFPYDHGKARALPKEAGYDEKNPLRYTIITHGAEASLATIATIMKTQFAKIGVEVTVEVLDRPIFLRRLTRDRDWDQVVVNVSAAIDSHTISRALDTHVGSNVTNYDDKHVDALIDRMRQIATEEVFRQAGDEFQRYLVESMITTIISLFGFLQAARGYVKGYENLHGYKLRFETTWLNK
jgi:ABC-type transport system substrate-binding protein